MSGTPAEQVAGLLAHADLRHTEVGGVRLLWQQWRCGSELDPETASPLLLLHGGFGSWTHWIANLEVLRRQRPVWSVDLPGLGGSGDMPRPHSTQHFAQILLSAWRSLIGGERRFELAGFSFGAMIGGHLAAQAGVQCQRCTLIGESGFGELHVQVPLLAPPGPEIAVEEAAAIHRENLSRLMFHDPGHIDDLAIHVHAENLAMHKFRSRALAGSNDLAQVLPAIPARLSGIWGEGDATAGGAINIERRRQLFRQAQPAADFHVLPDIGHWAMYEAPQAVNRILLTQTA